MTELNSGGRSASGQSWRAGERELAPSFSAGIEQQNLQGKNRSLPIPSKKRCRHLNWKEIETTVLINCIKEEGRFRKGKITDWEATRAEIEKVSGSPRTKKECQRRSDTLTKAQKQVTRLWGVNYKQFFESSEKERSGKLSTRLTQAWYEALEQIDQQQQKPGHHSSSNSGESPSLRGTQTPSRSDLAEDAGSGGSDLISRLQSSPSPVSTPFQDPAARPALPNQTHDSASTDLFCQQWARIPATPNRNGVPQVVQAETPKLHDGEDSGAVCPNHAPYFPLTLESLDEFLQSDCCCLRACEWISPQALDNVQSLYQFFDTLNLQTLKVKKVIN